MFETTTKEQREAWFNEGRELAFRIWREKGMSFALDSVHEYTDDQDYSFFQGYMSVF